MQRPALTATIEARSGRTVTLKLADNQELTVPTYLLPKEQGLGETIYLQLLSKSEHEASKLELAQHILEELLNGVNEK